MPAPRTSRRAAIEQTVQAAYDIARFTAEDPVAGLPDAQDIAGRDEQPDLDLFHPWDDRQRGGRATRAGAARRRRSRSTSASPTAKAPACRPSRSHFFCANSRGFCGGYASSRHSISVAPIARRRARHAARRLVHARCAMPTNCRAGGGRPLRRRTRAVAAERRARSSTRTCPVLFESPLAAGLLGDFVQAASGGALYRKSHVPARLPGQAGVCADTSTSARTRICRAARAARRSTRKACDHGAARWSTTACVQGYFLAPIRRASSA